MRGGCIVTPTRRRNSLPHSFVLCEIARSGPPSLNPPLLASPGTPGDAPKKRPAISSLAGLFYFGLQSSISKAFGAGRVPSD